MDEASQGITTWLWSLPAGHKIKWCSIEMPPEEPWGRKYADITILDYSRDEPGSWVFTVESPFRAEPTEESWYMQCDYDLDVHAVSYEDMSKGEFALTIPIPKGTPLTPEQDAALEHELAQKPGRRRGVVGAWSPQQISRALGEWCRRHTGRTDLRFEWDESADFRLLFPGLYQALEGLEEIASYEIAPNVKVTDGVMDELLKLDPDEAARFTASLQHLADSHRNYDPFEDG